jgi:uncharacterized membrane protein
MTRLYFLPPLILLAGCAAEPGEQSSGAPDAAVTSNRAEAPAQKQEPDSPTREPGGAAGACDTQDGVTMKPMRLRAVGTEPFWAARIEGRCVTYSHPEDQAGARVWTKFSGSAVSGTWTGNLNGKPFILRTRSEPGCSDGMSDRIYPIAVALTVNGEERSGCAEPL